MAQVEVNTPGNVNDPFFGRCYLDRILRQEMPGSAGTIRFMQNHRLKLANICPYSTYMYMLESY